MEMRQVGTLVFCAIGLSLALLVPPAQKYILFTMAAVPLALLVAGQSYLPRSKRSIRVWFNPIVIELSDELLTLESGMPLGRLSGRELMYSAFKQWHDFEIVPHRFWLVGAIGLVSLGAMWFSSKQEYNFVTGAAFFYLMSFVWVLMIAMSKRWLWERRMLRLEGIGIATFSVTLSSWHQNIRYHFVDPAGVYRGGWFESMVCNKDDTMTVIFYDEDNPDRSIPASALMFHKLAWKEKEVATGAASGSANV